MARAVGRALSRMGASRVAPVSGSWWLTEAPSSLATHRPSASAARATGLAATPTGWPTLPAAASRRTIVLSVALATHSPSPAATMAVGPLPTSMVWTTRPVGMLIRDTVRSPLLATQTESAVEVMPFGARPTSMMRTAAERWARSIWETVSAPVLVTQAEPAADGDAARPGADRDLADDLVAGRVDDADRVLASRSRGRLAATVWRAAGRRWPGSRPGRGRSRRRGAAGAARSGEPRPAGRPPRDVRRPWPRSPPRRRPPPARSTA